MFNFITKNKIQSPLRALWLDVRNLLPTNYNDYNIICSKEDYDLFKMSSTNEKEDILKTQLEVDYLIHRDAERSHKLIYIRRNSVSTRIEYYFWIDEKDKTNPVYKIGIYKHKERKEMITCVFNFSSRKSNISKHEEMYGPLFQRKIKKNNGQNTEHTQVCGYRTRILQLNDDISSIIDQYLIDYKCNKYGDRSRYKNTDFDFGPKGNIWDIDTLILDSFQDAYDLVHYTDCELKYTILYWFKEPEEAGSKFSLINLYGHTGYTYFVMNTSYEYNIPEKIMKRYDELVNSGQPPILPNDDTWKEQYYARSNDDIEPCENSYNYIKDREDPYFVQAVLESSLEDRQSQYCCLIVKRIHNNYDYIIERCDMQENLKIRKKYTNISGQYFDWHE